MLYERNRKSGQENQLREAFGNKLALEYIRFKRKMILMDSEEVFANAYKIDIYINLYEALLEMAESFSIQEITRLHVVPDLLECLYEGWLKTPDSQQKEIREYLKKSVMEKQEELA